MTDDACWVTTNSRVTVDRSQVVLEEFSFSAKQDHAVDQIAVWLANHALPQEDVYAYWREKVQNSLVILSENAFRDFVVNGTEVNTHVKINTETKTVKDGALWTQESLPADTLMVCSVVARNLRTNSKVLSDATSVLDWLRNANNLPSRVQIGGDETTGMGQVALRWHTGK